MLFQIVQVVGSLLILGAFVAAQARLFDQSSFRYLVPNAVGSAVLAATAVVGGEWGFVLLEAVWALVSLASIARRWPGRVGAGPAACGGDGVSDRCRGRCRRSSRTVAGWGRGGRRRGHPRWSRWLRCRTGRFGRTG